MAFSRNSLVAAVAGSLSLAMLTGCPAPNPATGGTPAPTGSAGTTPTAAPSTGASTTPTAAPSGTASVAPSAVPSASSLTPTTVQGKVYDESGALINSGAKVVIKSLNPSNPFETTIDVVNGNYVANQVPAGVLVQITAMRDGWTPRVQVATLLPLATASNGNLLDFGGSTNPYFISKYPEITSVEPADEATLADASSLTYKLTLSEALDSDNRSRFASALRVWPANDNAEAPGVTNVGDLNADDADATTDRSGAGFAPAREGTPFLTASNVATISWDASGTVATFSFKAPQKASTEGKARYAVGLTADELTARIQDSENNQLGQATSGTTAADSAFTNYADQNLILNAFKKPDLPTLSSATLTAAQRWNETHDNVAEYDVAEDDTDPTLASATVSGRNVITLTFSEPMAAASGAKIVNNASNTTKYFVQISDSENELNDATIDDATSATPVTQLSDITAEGTVYTFDASAFEAIVDENDAKVVRIRRQGILTSSTAAADRFDSTKVKFVRVKVLSAVADPAGNGVTTSNDAALKTVTL